MRVKCENEKWRVWRTAVRFLSCSLYGSKQECKQGEQKDNKHAIFSLFLYRKIKIKTKIKLSGRRASQPRREMALQRDTEHETRRLVSDSPKVMRTKGDEMKGPLGLFLFGTKRIHFLRKKIKYK